MKYENNNQLNSKILIAKWIAIIEYEDEKRIILKNFINLVDTIIP